MRIATWNVNGIRARIDFVCHWLRERQPDVVGLQELKAPDAEFPLEEVEACGYRVLGYGQKSWNGVAILTRGDLPVEELQRGLPGQADFGARLLSARVGDGADAIDFTTVYGPNGKSTSHDDFPKKLAWYDDLSTHLEGRLDPTSPAVLCGDFNVVPTALDSWNEAKLGGHVFHTDEERKRVRRLLDWGFCDLFRDAHPDDGAFSWWDYRGGAFHRKQGLRIDFLLGTPAVASRVREVGIDRDWRKKLEGLTPSDHVPVVADLDPAAS